jgi:hypothetical protein
VETGAEALNTVSRILVILNGCSPNPDVEALGYKAVQTDYSPPLPSHLLVPSSLPCAPPTTGMSTNLYEILGVQRDASEDQSAFNPCPWSCPVLNALFRLQSERHIRNGRYKPTRIVFPQNGRKQREMSFERFFLSKHPLCYTAHSWPILGQQRIRSAYRSE